MAYEFKTQRRVEFAETDMAGIVYFANFFRYMEEAEHAFFRSLGLRVHTDTERGAMGWARVHAECSYHRPAYYEDVLDVHLLVGEKRTKSISYQITFQKTGIAIAHGTIAVVCVQQTRGHDQMQAAVIPPEVDARIEVAPADLLT